MLGPRPAPAASTQNPGAAPSAPAAAAARVREEGEVSSGADDDEALQTHIAAPSNVGRYVEAGAQVPLATFRGKGSNTLSVSNVMTHIAAAPSYKKTMRLSQGQFKPGTNRNLTWQKPVSSDNLVITFSDDDSGSDSGKTKQDRVRDRKASSQGTQKTGNNMQTRIMREEAPQHKTHAAKIGSANFPAFPLTLRNAGAGRGSGTTFFRREPSVRQVTPLKSKQKDGNGVGVNSADHRLESLRHKIAARENELKGQKRPLVPVVTKNADFSTEKIELEASSGECSRLNSPFEHDGGPIKRLKLNQQHSYNQVHSDLVTLAPISCSSGKNNVQSSEVTDHFENGTTMHCNVDEREHAVTTEFSGQIQHGGATKNPPSSKTHHKGMEGADNHATVELRGRLAAPFTNGQIMPETSALVPVTSAQAGQRVMPVGTSTVLNLRPHLQPGEENADLLNYSGQIGVEGQNTRLLSLLEMEELQERELEDAQEHRQKCEVEEREALRAYRKAQRALIEANERCTILRRKREICSAQVHGFIAENSPLVQSLSIQNAGDGLAMPSLLNSQIHADCQLPENQGGRYSLYPDEPPQQPVDKHEAQPHYRDELAASTADPNFVNTANDNSMPSDYMEDDLLFPARRARSECASDLENHMEETIHVHAEENRQASGDSVQDYELLEASLRSRLVERFGKKPCLNSTGEGTEEIAVGKVAGAEHDKQSAHELQLQEAEQNVVTTLEDTMELGNDDAGCAEKTGGLSNSSSGPSMGNCNPNDNISSLKELCMPLSTNSPIFPSSAPQNAARHIKGAFPGFCKEASDLKNDCLVSDAASEAAESVQDMIQDRVGENVKMLPTTQKDSDMAHSGIDPFWPFCMFELRGKCNDEECQWQHAEHHAWRKSKHTKHAMTSVSGLSPYGLFRHFLPVPAYRVGSNLIKSDLNLMQSVLASSLWQYWQRGFCASFPLPISVQRILPSDAPFLQAGDGSIADFDTNRQLLNFRMLDSRKNKIVQGSVDVEFFLEAALGLYCGKVNKPDRIKALLLLARAIEADPSTAILWVFYLHIYYQKDEGLGKDDMFSDAVQHNVYSYELWLMYINSRLRFDDRLDAYNDALSMLCQMTADTDKDLKERSAFTLDIFLQMIYFLCMSGNVEKAISRIFGILPTATPDNSGDKLLTDVISCLTMSDRCIFWISCLYVSIYAKLPEEITDQLEFQKALPRALVWLPIEPSVDNRSHIIELLKHAAYKMAIDISESVKNGDPSYLTLAQFLAVNHISCLAALEGFKSSADMLVKYMKEYPMCPQIFLISGRLERKYGTCSGMKGFDELLLNWHKEVQGIQYLWNQYAEHALADNIELAEKVLACWFEEYGEDCDLQSNVAVGALLASAQEVGSGPSISEDQVFWLLNLSLYKILENNLLEAQVAVDKALKLAHGECYEYCLREHAAIHMLEKSSSTADAQTRATFSFIIGYLADHRNLPTRDLLSRRFCQNVKKHKLKQLIDDTIGPTSVDSSLINSVLEVCFGPSLLPEKIGEVKYLVDFVESVMEVLPANYHLALALGRFVGKHYTGADPTSMGTRFWASSVLINAIFRAVPVAPESVWLEGASLLEKLQAAETVKRFHQQATSVYPFSYKLWHTYLNTCKASGNNTESIMEAARQRGIELNLTPT
ncbi:uncharacterized protein LOC133905004 isoform X2 [Phragmites australis]|uniref:uncharacterized protein LOC133905004 isoform X2 n=1 Tax=Phragmites australis TaxID=29695 RepID=UPI002D76F632|nr:uncharacterized protein LOC133905004 isoform X2 [Phragmites australis]